MPRNGSGTYTAPANTFNPATTGTTLSSSDWNSVLTDLETALTNSIAKDGQTTITANLPMSTFKHTGVGDSSARDQYASMGQLQDNKGRYLTSVSGTDTITATASFSLSSYAAGQSFVFVASGTNTGAVTININTIGAKAIQKNGQALVAGDITANDIVHVIYDGTQFQMVSPARTPVLKDQSVSGTKLDIDGLSGKTTPVDADSFVLKDSADSNTAKELTLENLKTEILKTVYPVGAYYISDTSTDPNTVLGFGTWTAVEGKMLIGADATYTAGSEGGSDTTTQTTSTLVSHNHGLERFTDSPSTGGADRVAGSGADTNTGSRGGGNAMTTISPYRAAYIWRRTA